MKNKYNLPNFTTAYEALRRMSFRP